MNATFSNAGDKFGFWGKTMTSVRYTNTADATKNWTWSPRTTLPAGLVDLNLLMA